MHNAVYPECFPDKPHLSPEPHSIFAFQESSVSLNCYITVSNRIFNIEWFKVLNNGDLSPTPWDCSDGSCIISNIDYSLTFLNVSRIHERTYQCRVTAQDTNLLHDSLLGPKLKLVLLGMFIEATCVRGFIIVNIMLYHESCNCIYCRWI